jgi:hypothetical protein
MGIGGLQGRWPTMHGQLPHLTNCGDKRMYFVCKSVARVL